jgi:hypothetical protein
MRQFEVTMKSVPGFSRLPSMVRAADFRRPEESASGYWEFVDERGDVFLRLDGESESMM